MKRAAAVLLLVGCQATAVVDAGAGDRPDVPRIDAGFVPDALAPCVLEEGLGFDGADYASYDFGEDPAARRLFASLVIVDRHGGGGPSDVLAERRARAEAAAACDGELACVRMQIGFDEVSAAAAAEAALEAIDDRSSFDADLSASGSCARDADASGCITRTLLELGVAMGVLGEIPAEALAELVGTIATEAQGAPSFSFAITALVQRGLVLADRPEPLRYEPLEDENAAAIAALRDVDWDTFPFIAIAVPGQGPTDATTALNPAGRARADLGYERWRAGMAPVLVLSGGHVHPDRTIYSEAIEMRRYLIEERAVPGSAILVEPYARHTTTNLRNVTRVLARAGAPMDRPILITTDFFQSTYIGSDGFGERCDEELGYRPFVAMLRLSSQDLCIAASRASLGVAPSDPLDP